MTTDASCDLVRACLWTVGAVVALKVVLLAGGWSHQASQEAAVGREVKLAAGSCCTDDLGSLAGGRARRAVEPAAWSPEVSPRAAAAADGAPCRARRRRR
jgi:hypothetical protein